jgi:hypothetical protein
MVFTAKVFFNGFKVTLIPLNMSMYEISQVNNNVMYYFKNEEENKIALDYDDEECMFIKRFSTKQKLFTKMQASIIVEFDGEKKTVKNSLHNTKNDHQKKAMNFLNSLRF